MKTKFHCECCDVAYDTPSLAESCEILHGKPSRSAMHKALTEIHAAAVAAVDRAGESGPLHMSPDWVLCKANEGLGRK